MDLKSEFQSVLRKKLLSHELDKGINIFVTQESGGIIVPAGIQGKVEPGA